MDFAPYQDTSPETERALSPRHSLSISPNPTPSNPRSPKTSLNLPRPDLNNLVQGERGGYGQIGGRSAVGERDLEAGGLGGGSGSERRGRLDEFATSLPIRLDYEACLAYLLLPPAGAVLLLLVEHKSDYVRFHAWQSSLLFTAMFLLHLLFSWSTFFSWFIFIGDLVLIGYLTFRAYVDADMLERCEVPFFGPLASRILDDE